MWGNSVGLSYSSAEEDFADPSGVSTAAQNQLPVSERLFLATEYFLECSARASVALLSAVLQQD